jgi:hypothetical protein
MAIRQYLEAINEINEADRELRGILTTVRRTARLLPERWATLSVLGIDQPLIPEVPPGHERHAIKSTHWPTIEHIARVLSRVHRSYDAAEAVWATMAPELRGRLSPPPKKFIGVESP